MSIWVRQRVIDEIVQHARACSPEEGCGFLVGRGGSADRFIPAFNLLHSETAFRVEPAFLFDLFRQLRVTGEKVAAIYHSHPKGPVSPSKDDVAQASYPDAAQIIVSLGGARPQVRAYWIRGSEVREADLRAIV